MVIKTTQQRKNIIRKYERETKGKKNQKMNKEKLKYKSRYSEQASTFTSPRNIVRTATTEFYKICQLLY